MTYFQHEMNVDKPCKQYMVSSEMRILMAHTCNWFNKSVMSFHLHVVKIFQMVKPVKWQLHAALQSRHHWRHCLGMQNYIWPDYQNRSIQTHLGQMLDKYEDTPSPL